MFSLPKPTWGPERGKRNYADIESIFAKIAIGLQKMPLRHQHSPLSRSPFKGISLSASLNTSVQATNLCVSCSAVSDSLHSVDRSQPGSSVHVIWARILEWVAISFSRWSSPPRDQTRVFCIAGRFFFFNIYHLSHREASLKPKIPNKDRFVFLLLNFENSLCIIDTNSLPDK